MQSLKEVYGNIRQQDHEKVAQARAAQGLPPQVDMSQVDPDLVKQAQDYDRVGRILAHQVFADGLRAEIEKIAGDAPEEKKEEMVQDLMSQARGEKKEEKKDEKKDEGKTEEEHKKEAAKAAILHRMSKDPKYLAQLTAKHQAKQGHGGGMPPGHGAPPKPQHGGAPPHMGKQHPAR